MDLEKITIIPRQRNSWEAVDLGFKMAREWWRPLFLSWLLPSVLFFVLCTVIFYDKPWLVSFLVWWLKPVWDRFPLYLASRKLFSEEVSYRQLLSASRMLIGRDVFAWLSWRRFSLTRSMDMPVTVLENLRSGKRAKRLQVLHYRSGNAANWLTIVCIHLELVVSFGLLALFVLLVPNEVEVPWFDIFINGTLAEQHMLNALTYFSMSLIAPFYTLAGFALYISRRVELEAWDIEIRFRQMAEKFKQKQRRGFVSSSVLPICCLAFVFLFFIPAPVVFANTNPVTSTASIDNKSNEPLSVVAEEFVEERDFSERVIQNIMESDTFRNKKTIKQWRWKNSEKMQQEEIPGWVIRVVEWFESIFVSTRGIRAGVKSGAYILEITLWVLFASIIVYLLLKYRYALAGLLRGKLFSSKTSLMPVELFGLDVTEKSLPDDIPATVMLLWESSQKREALALLFRAMLTRLMHEHGFRFKDGYTELECVRLVEEAGNSEFSVYMRELALMWQKLAYAHMQPGKDQVVKCCEQWQVVFPDAK